jgi:peptide/nickel transport system substrate-binding protein
MRPLHPIGVLVLATLVGLVACGDDEPVPGKAPGAERTTLVVAMPSDVSGVNELLSSSQGDHEIRSQLFLHLVREQPDYQEHPPTFAAELARSWTFSDDRRTLTFELRDDVLWSDGAPVTAHDVRFSWQAQKAPEVGWAYGYVKEKISDVEVLEEHRVRFHFTEVYPTQLPDANEGFVLPRHAWSELPFAEWRENADWFREHLVVNGPFTLGSWRPQQEVALLPNPLYHREGLPRSDMVLFRVVPEEANRMGQLLAGEIHAMVGVPPARARDVEESPATRLVSVDSRQYTYVVWNTLHPLFEEAAIRRALTLAIDRQALVDALWHGHARVGVGPFTSRVWAHDPSLEPWPFEPEQARQIFAEHGWQDTDGDGVLDRDGEPFAFELSTNTGNQLRRDTLVLLQSQLERVGVQAEPVFLEPQTLFARNEAHDFDATLGGWAIDTSLDVRYAFHSDEIDGGYNYGSFSDRDADRLMDEIAATVPPEAALDRYHRLERILHEQQPYTFLWEPDGLIGLASAVREADPNALLSFYDLEEWSLEEAPAVP